MVYAININLFLESSAKTGVNVQEIFIEAAKILYQDYLNYQKKVESAGQPQEMSQLVPENQKLNKKRMKRKIEADAVRNNSYKMKVNNLILILFK